ncbi:hypothetical protein GGF31_004222 [Allomyces arbusculus]|nr:hypothetical protein GGF31_004222 [Allomyces arbusculus]
MRSTTTSILTLLALLAALLAPMAPAVRAETITFQPGHFPGIESCSTMFPVKHAANDAKLDLKSPAQTGPFNQLSAAVNVVAPAEPAASVGLADLVSVPSRVLSPRVIRVEAAPTFLRHLFPKEILSSPKFAEAWEQVTPGIKEVFKTVIDFAEAIDIVGSAHSAKHRIPPPPLSDIKDMTTKLSTWKDNLQKANPKVTTALATLGLDAFVKETDVAKWATAIYDRSTVTTTDTTKAVPETHVITLTTKPIEGGAVSSAETFGFLQAGSLRTLLRITGVRPRCELRDLSMRVLVGSMTIHTSVLDRSVPEMADLGKVVFEIKEKFTAKEIPYPAHEPSVGIKFEVSYKLGDAGCVGSVGPMIFDFVDLQTCQATKEHLANPPKSLPVPPRGKENLPYSLADIDALAEDDDDEPTGFSYAEDSLEDLWDEALEEASIVDQYDEELDDLFFY